MKSGARTWPPRPTRPARLTPPDHPPCPRCTPPDPNDEQTAAARAVLPAQSAFCPAGPLPITTNLKLVLPRSFRRHALRADEESLNPSDLRPQPSPLERYRRPEFEVVVGARARIWVCLGRRAANFENSNSSPPAGTYRSIRGLLLVLLCPAHCVVDLNAPSMRDPGASGKTAGTLVPRTSTALASVE